LHRLWLPRRPEVSTCQAGQAQAEACAFGLPFCTPRSPTVSLSTPVHS